MDKSKLSEKVEKSRRIKPFIFDLRIHSPGMYGYKPASASETANAIVRLAIAKGIDTIAITDTFGCANIKQVMEAALNQPLNVIPATEIICSLNGCSEMSFISLFPESGGVELVRDYIIKIRERVTLEAAINETEVRGGIIFPSRVDKTPPQQKMIPVLVDRFGFRAFDLAYPDSIRFFKKNWRGEKFQFLSFSNATSLAQIGSRTSKLKVLKGDYASISPFFRREEERSVCQVAL